MSEPKEESTENWTILECPDCQSRRAGILRTDPPKAKCTDCGNVYEIATLPPPIDSLSEKKPKKTRQSVPGERHRRDNGPQTLEVTAVPPLTPKELGTMTATSNELVSGGPEELLNAKAEAARLSEKLGEQFEAQWFLRTSYLNQLQETHPTRAEHALVWRPRFLAVVSLSRSVMMGCKVAKVDFKTVQSHEEQDPDFAAQVEAAKAHAVALLHDACFASALEGDCEPVYWQGIKVGHIRKFDSRLRIEMLRAYKPEKFKGPGQSLKVTFNQQNNNLVMATPELTEDIRARRRAALETEGQDSGPVNQDRSIALLRGRLPIKDAE